MISIDSNLRTLLYLLPGGISAFFGILLLVDDQPFYSAAMLGSALLFGICVIVLLRSERVAREEKCRTDEQLIQSHKLASIGELSSGLAHEINNPLAIIGQEAQLMRDLLDTGDPASPDILESIRDSLREIIKQVARCGDITHKLLDFARKSDPLPQGVDVNRLVEDIVKLVERETTQRNISIIRNFMYDVPTVYTDAPLLRQIVLNLLNNAAAAVGSDGKVTITTRLEGADNFAMEIEDTGCGIPKENLARIFDPFFTTKPPGKGTGLGLSLCHGFITRLGGQIRVASELGRGACFTVILPLRSERGVA